LILSPDFKALMGLHSQDRFSTGFLACCVSGYITLELYKRNCNGYIRLKTMLVM